MREITAVQIEETVRRLCMEANRKLPEDIKDAVRRDTGREEQPLARNILEDLKRNWETAEELNLPVCQDTGMAVVFVRLGQEVHIDGSLEEAIQEGVRRGYLDGYLRKSVVSDPIERINTLDNTPAVITYDVVMGDRLTITVAPKGAGSENMGRLAMLKPSDGLAGVKRFVLDAVEAAGPNPCPPIVVGVGIGGNFDRVALLAKRALLRPIDRRNPNPAYAALETELLDSINALGIGPQGFGGRATALGVNIEVFATHIAQLPCAVNIGCHVTRHQTAVL